jgi:hemerythrin-like metal-binding protein
MKLEWQSDYAIGDAEIDAQHQALFEAADLLLGANDRDSKLFTVIRLMRLTQVHFAHEEQVMQQIGYPDMANHFKQHTDLLSQLNGLAGTIADESVSPAELEHFVTAWLQTHVAVSDTKLVAFLQRNPLYVLPARGSNAEARPQCEVADSSKVTNDALA